MQITRVTQTQLPSKFWRRLLGYEARSGPQFVESARAEDLSASAKGQGRSTRCKVSSNAWCLPSRWNRQKWASCFCFRSTAAECALIWILSLESQCSTHQYACDVDHTWHARRLQDYFSPGPQQQELFFGHHPGELRIEWTALLTGSCPLQGLGQDGVTGLRLENCGARVILWCPKKVSWLRGSLRT